MKCLSLTILVWMLLVASLVAQTSTNPRIYNTSNQLLSNNFLESTITPSFAPASTTCSVTIDSVLNVGCNGDSTGAIYTTTVVDTSSCTSSVVALNEFMYNPNALHRDGLDPYAGEYIELIGPTGMDISCYVLTDGDWTITLPAGSIIPPDGFFTIGNDSIWGTGTFDLDAENCNCFTDVGGGLLILTNSNGEYVALFDAAGTFLQGVIYGTPTVVNSPPTTPTAITTVGTAGCPASVTIPTAVSFETAPGGVPDEVSLIRSPDGSGAWVTQVGGSLNACNNASTGTNTVSYLWSNGDTTENISGLPAGTYTVTLTSSSGCTDTATYTITEPAVLVAITNATTTGCVGDSTGTIDLTITGGTGSYLYNWSNGATTEDLSLLSVGNYCVTVVDSNICMITACDSIEEPTFMIPVDTFYIGQGDTVQLQVNTNVTTLNWTPSGTLSNATIASPLAFPSTTTTYYINTPTSLSTNLVVNGDFENGNVSFSSTYTVGTGGTWGLLSNEGTYVVNTNANNTHTNFSSCTDHTLGTGNYMVINGATIANQTIWCQTVNVTPNTNYQLSTWVTSVEATNPANLQFTINGIDIGNPFTASTTTCQWDQFFSTWNSGTNTSATLCITNQNVGNSGNDFGLDDIEFRAICSLSDSIVVIVDSLNASLATVNPLCNGDTTGSIITTAAGNYNYLWNTGDTTTNLTNIGAGTYMLTVSSGSCQDTLSTTLTEPTVIALSLSSSTNPSCNGDTTGAIVVTNSGGTMPYTYSWSNGATTQNLNNISAGSYNLILTDDNQCTAPLSIALTEPSAISVSYSTTNVSCGGSNDGTASVTPAGGTPGYTYLWDVTANNQTTATAINLATNTYSVTVTDLEGCTTEANGVFVNPGIPVDSNDVPLVVVTGTLDCALNPVGSLEINTANTYNYLWSNGETSRSVTNLPAGTYSVTVTNGLGCTYVQTANINSPFVPTINPFIVNAGSTSTAVTAGTTVNINGGNDQSFQGVMYNWTSSSADVDIATSTTHTTTAMSTITGAYVLTLTATANDSTACQDTGSVVLNVESVYFGMPNAFTPNEDGVNDLYRPTGLNGDDIITFRVYNRWGQEVYNGDSLENMGWDGRFQGAEQPTEVYLFVLEYKLGANSEAKVHKGEFSLIR